MADLKPVYLVHGDDDARIDEWRARLRKRAEAELGPGGLEAFDGRTQSPGDVSAALSTLSFATGTRYLLVDEVGAWKAPDAGAAHGRPRSAPAGHGAGAHRPRQAPERP